MVNWGDERLPDKFWDRVSPCPVSGCWNWTGFTIKGSTPMFESSGLKTTARRLAWGLLGSGDVQRIASGCGNDVCVNPHHLREGVKGEIGNRYGRLVVTSRADKQSPDGAMWVCKCDCGVEKIIEGTRLRCGAYKSCNCLRDEQLSTHGARVNGKRPPEYGSWANMIQRCTNSRNISYPRYGGRGISICASWRSFENFLADMGTRPPGTSLDRIDPNGNYEKSNCRWADTKTQVENRRGATGRTSSFLGDAISKVASNDNASYSKDEVLSMLRVLRFNLCG